MAVLTRKPRSATLRFQTFLSTDDITKQKPERSLTVGLRRTGGRNAYGRITTRHHGGGAARRYRIVDFRRSIRGIEGVITAVEYDPNRNVRLGLVLYITGARRYMLLPEGVRVGDKVLASEFAEPKPGCAMPLSKVPVGFFVHNIELSPGKGGKIARSAGTSAQIVARDENYTTLKMPSGEIRLVSSDCWATVGILGNQDAKNVIIGKAGRTRHLGIRPTVRGMAMNPVDHPHGGGEGRSKSGSHPTTPWGKGCKGTKTRKRKNALIIKRRK